MDDTQSKNGGQTKKKSISSLKKKSTTEVYPEMEIPSMQAKIDNSSKGSPKTIKRELEFLTPRDLDIEVHEHYRTFYSNLEKLNRPAPSTQDLKKRLEIKDWLKDVRNATEEYLSGYIVRYSDSPITSMAIFDHLGEYIIFGSENNIVIKESKQYGREVLILKGHKETIRCLALSPDQCNILSGGDDKMVKVFNISSGKEVLSIMDHEKTIRCVAFCKNGLLSVSSGDDAKIRLIHIGRREVCFKDEIGSKPITCVEVIKEKDDEHIVFGSLEGKIYFFKLIYREVQTQEQKQEEIKLELENKDITLPDLVGVTSLSSGVFKERKIILCGCNDKTMRIFDFVQKNEIYKFKDHTEIITSVSISNNNRFVASGDRKNNIIIYDIFVTQIIGEFKPKKPEKAIIGLKFSPHNNDLLSVTEDNILKLYEMASGDFKLKFSWAQSKIRSIAYSPDGSRIYAGSEDGMIRIYESATTHQVNLPNTIGPLIIEKGLLTLAISPNGKYLIAGKSTIFHIDLENPEIKKEYPAVHTKAVRCLNFSPDGKYFISGGDDNMLKITSVETSQELYKATYKEMVCAVAFSPNGVLGISGGADKMIRVHDIKEKKVILTIQSHEECVRSLVYSYDGSMILSGSYDKTVKLFDAKDGSELRTFLGHTDYVLSVAFSPDAKFVLSGGEDLTVLLFSVQTGMLLRKFSNFKKGVRSVAFSPKGAYILAGSEDGKLCLFDIIEKFSYRSFTRHSDAIICIAISPDETKLATSSDDQSIKIFDIEKGNELITMRCPDTCTTIVFSKDGFFVLAGGNDSVMRLFHIYLGVVVRTYTGHQEWISSVCFSPDGKYAVSGSVDKTIRVYEAISCEMVKVLPDQNEAEDEDEADKKDVPVDKLISDIDTIQSEYISLAPAVVCCIGFTANGKFLLSSGDDFLVRMYDFEKNKIVKSFKGHKKTVSCFSISYDDKYLVSGDEDGVICVFTLADAKRIYSFDGHSAMVNSIGFSFDGLKFVSVDEAGSKFVLNTQDGTLLKNFEQESVSIRSVAFFDKGNKIASAGDDKGARIFDAITKEELPFYSLSSKIINLAISKDGKYVAVMSEGSLNINIFEIYSGKLKFHFKGMKKVNSMIFSNNSEKILIAGDEAVLQIHYFSTTKEPEVIPITTHHQKAITSAAFSSDDKIVYTGSDDCIIRMQHLIKKDEYMLEYHKSPIKSIFVIKNNKKNDCLVSSDEDDNILVYDVTFKTVTIEINLYKEGIKSISVSPDDKYLLIGGEDKIIRLFDLVSGSEIRTFIGHTEEVKGVAFSSNISKVISGSSDKSLKVFDIDSGAELQSISSDLPILKLAASMTSDSICIGTEGGLQIITRLFNQSNIVSQNFIYLKEDNRPTADFDFKPADLSIVPYPLIFNKMHYLSAFDDNKKTNLEMLCRKFANSAKDENTAIVESCIFFENSLGFSPWDYWINLVDNQHKINLYKKLILLITSRYIQGIHKMKKKTDFLRTVISDFPSKMPNVLEAFLKKSDDINLRRCSKHPLPLFKSPDPNPCPRVIEREYQKILNSREITKEEYFSLAVKINQITPEEIADLLESISKFPASHALFKSQTLVIILEHLWIEETRSNFLWHFKAFVLFLLLVMLQVIWVFPERQSITGKPYIEHYRKGAIIFNILICSILLLYYFRRLCALIYHQYKALNTATSSHHEQSGSEFGLKKKGSIHSNRKNIQISWQFPLLMKSLIKSLPIRVWLDLVFIASGCSSSIIDIIWIFEQINSGQFQETSILSLKLILAIFFFTCWIRFLDYARGFQITSALIRMLSRVLYDMFGFLIILFFMIIGMAFSTFIIQNNYDQQNPWEFFQKFFYMLMGDFGDYKETPTMVDQDLYFVILLGATVFIVIVMLNLLIAIISDSFEKVMALEKQADVFEKLQLIIERKRSLPKKKQIDDKRTYLFQLEKEETKQGENIEERLRNKIDSIEKNQETHDKYFIEIKNSIDLLKREFFNEVKLLRTEIRLNLEEESKRLKGFFHEARLRGSTFNKSDE